jgi:hypothetical protein
VLARVAVVAGVSAVTCASDRARFETGPATRLVAVFSADQHLLVLGHDALGARGRRAADDAHGVQLRHRLGDGHQVGHRRERPPEIVLIEPCQDDPQPTIRERLGDFDDPDVEELRLVDRDHVRALVNFAENAVARCQGDRLAPLPIMRDDGGRIITSVDAGLERLDVLARELRSLQPPEELLRLAAEHAPDDDLDRAHVPSPGATGAATESTAPVRRCPRVIAARPRELVEGERIRHGIGHGLRPFGSAKEARSGAQGAA